MITAIDLAVMRYPEDCGGHFVIIECLPQTFVDILDDMKVGLHVTPVSGHISCYPWISEPSTTS
jgi:hypothetical protein